MGWVTLLPNRPNKNCIPCATITINRGTGRFTQRMLLTIRTALLDKPPAWLKADAPVNVEAGNGEHAGQYRITPGGPWRLRRAAGPNQQSAFTLKLPVPANAPPDGCRQLGVDIKHSAGGVDIKLPRLHAPAEPVPEAAAKRPYLGISERVPDPAAAIQAANGARVR